MERRHFRVPQKYLEKRAMHLVGDWRFSAGDANYSQHLQMCHLEKLVTGIYQHS